jgi:hypothetical protein
MLRTILTLLVVGIAIAVLTSFIPVPAPILYAVWAILGIWALLVVIGMVNGSGPNPPLA